MMNELNGSHLSVMMAETLDALAIRHDGFYVDCTFGRGGHSSAVLQLLGNSGRLLAMDRDAAAVDSTEAKSLLEDSRFLLVHGNFTGLMRQIERLGMVGIKAVVARAVVIAWGEYGNLTFEADHRTGYQGCPRPHTG